MAKPELERLWETMAEYTSKYHCRVCPNFGDTELFKNSITFTDCYDCHKIQGLEYIREKQC